VSVVALSREVADPLLAHVTGARWFGGKGRRTTLVGVTPLPWLTPPPDDLRTAAEPAVRLEVVELAHPDGPVNDEATGGPDRDSSDGPSQTGPRELYQVAIAYRAEPQADLEQAEIGRWTDAELGPVVAYDATQDPEASAALLRSLLAEVRLRRSDAEVGFHLSAAQGLTADLVPSVFRGQQSNTSVMFGDVAMLKLFRRLELGRNLDIEVHDALSRTGMADVARLFGWAEASWTRTDPATGETGTVSADLAMMVEKLAQATDGWDLALDALRAGRSFTDEARALGAALAETHAALRTAFPTGRQPGSDVAQVMGDRLTAARGIAAQLEPYVEPLQQVFGALAGSDLDVQRVHGDFHLGQTLHTPGGWKIIDFEGEPVKTLAERAAPDSVWRDIAGMLRSFGYAAASVPGPDSEAWAAGCRQAFLEGYAGGELSADDAATLRAYEADKAVYEVVYEVRNRPEWIAIPLGAVADLAGSSKSTKE
jgi:maltokinase